MESSWWERWRRRLRSTWAVFTGRAYAGYYEPPDVATMVAEAELKESARVFLGEFDAFWNDPQHVKHPKAEAFSYLRSSRDRLAARL